MITVADYDPAWRDTGAELATRIRDGLGPLAARVEHIGSTSIPGLAAKPIFDLQASVRAVADPARFHSRRGPVQPHTRRSRRRLDHTEPDANLHVRLALLFRDWFRSHPEAIPGYARFERALASQLDDTEVYSDIKDPIVDVIIAVAEPWAAAAGWTP
jgi:GrpB-like predicted nucleotidyltransferase (UPF0157 family)